MIDPKYDEVGGTFSGPDLAALTSSILEAAPYAVGKPLSMSHNFRKMTVPDDWRAQILAPEVDGLKVSWGNYKEQILRNNGAIGVDFPSLPFDPAAILEFVAPLPFDVAVMPPLVGHQWNPGNEDIYFCPAIGATHALLGWGAIIKGDGHWRRMSSRRWIEHGPWLVFHGPEDTTFIQFHELDIDAEASLPQAQAAHDWMIRGYLRPDHPFEHDISGIYTAEDKLLRVVVPDREVTDRELHDACVAKRDGRNDPDKPIENIAYIFMDENAARAHLDRIWLRGLECRTIRDGKEIRLDEHHRIERRVGWW